MYEIVSTELKFWKLALRESYYLDLISKQDLMRMHSAAFYDSINDPLAGDVLNIELVFNIMGDSDLFVDLMKTEAVTISKGIAPIDKDIFKKMWVSYLLDCRDAEYITNSQFDVYCNRIEFDGSIWSESELEAAHDIIEIVRLMLVHENPKLAMYIENPSFDLLMYMNNLEYV